jgi:hypothetical protein
VQEKARAFHVFLLYQDPSGHQAILGTAFFSLAVFVVLYVLVYIECLLRHGLRILALLTWACLLMLGYVLVWDSWKKVACAWEQVTVLLASRAHGSPTLGMGPFWGMSLQRCVAVALLLLWAVAL